MDMDCPPRWSNRFATVPTRCCSYSGSALHACVVTAGCLLITLTSGVRADELAATASDEQSALVVEVPLSMDGSLPIVTAMFLGQPRAFVIAFENAPGIASPEPQHPSLFIKGPKFQSNPRILEFPIFCDCGPFTFPMAQSSVSRHAPPSLLVAGLAQFSEKYLIMA